MNVRVEDIVTTQSRPVANMGSYYYETIKYNQCLVRL